MTDKARKVLKYVPSVLVAVLLVFFAFRGTDWQDFFRGLAGTDWWFILASVVVAVIALVLRAERWRSQLLPLDEDIRWSSVWHGSNIGNFLNVVIPGTGEFYRCGHVCTGKAKYDKVFGTIIMERSWDVLAIIVLLIVAAFTNTQTIAPFLQENVLTPFAHRFRFSIWWLVAAVVVFLVLAVWLVFLFKDKSKVCGKISGWMKGILSGFVSFKDVKGKPLFFIYTIGIWVMYILMTYFTFLAVPGLEHLTFADAVFISAVGNIASVIPTPGNIGPYHYLVGLAISSIYLGAEGMAASALLCATLSHGSHAILIIILGIYSYIRISLKKKK